MPFGMNCDLPPSVRSHLPEHAQDIDRAAFNHAFAPMPAKGFANGART
jgi:cation transport regulator